MDRLDRFLLVTHEVGTVPVHQVRGILERRSCGGMFIHHPLQYRRMASDVPSRAVGWGDVVVRAPLGVPLKVGSEAASYVKDFALTVLWVSRSRVTFDTMIAAGNLNALAGLALRRMGRVRHVIYYAIDFSDRRFNGAVLESTYRQVDEMVLRAADTTWHVSDAMRAARASRFPRAFAADCSRHIVVPIGVHARRMRAVAADIRDAGGRVVFLGNLLRHHGLEVVIEAVARLRTLHPSIHLDIYGDGPDRRSCEAIVTSLGLQSVVKFHGYVEDDERLECELGRGGVAVAMYSPFLATFTKYADPGKVKQYLGAGLPIVMTDVPPNAKSLSGGCALICGYSIDECASALHDLLVSPDRYRAMREAAFSEAARLEWGTLIINALGRRNFPQ